MSILIFWPGVTQIPSIPSSRRRYVEDPLYAIAIGDRLPMNVVTGDANNLSHADMRDGDFVLSRNGTEFKLAAFDETNNIWQLFDTTVTLDSRYVNITGDTMTGDLQINGSLTTGAARIKSTEISTTTATMSDTVEIHFCDGVSAYTLTLPTQVDGKEIKIINKNTGVATLSPASGNIMGESTQVINQYETIILVSDGTDWF